MGNRSRTDQPGLSNGLVKDMFKYLPAQVIPGLVGFVSIPIITRLFPPGDYGNYSLVLATVLILTTLMDWLSMSIIRFFPAYAREDRLPFFLGHVVKLTGISLLAILLLAGGLYLGLARFVSSDLDVLLRAGLAVFLFTSIFNICQNVLRTRRQVGWFSGFIVTKSIAGFGLGLGFVHFLATGIEGFFYGTVAGLVLLYPLLWRKSLGKNLFLNIRLESRLVREMARYSFPLVIGNLAAWVLSLSDRYLLELLRSSEEVGIYSAGYNIAEKTIMVMTNLFLFASGPIGVHIWEREPIQKSREFRTGLTRYYLMACVPFFVTLSVLARPIMSLLTDTQYFAGFRIIPYVTLGIVFLGLQQRYHAAFLFYKKTGFISLAIALAGILNLALNLLFIPRYGIMAAAVSTVVSYVFLLALMVVVSRRFFVWAFPWRTLGRVASASAVMGGIMAATVHLLKTGTMVKIAVSGMAGIFMYFVLLYGLREFSHEEIQTAVRWVRRLRQRET